MRVEIDYDRCQSIAMCNVLAPEVFLVGDDGVNRVLRAKLEGSDIQPVEEAVAACPAFALRMHGHAEAPA